MTPSHTYLRSCGVAVLGSLCLFSGTRGMSPEQIQVRTPAELRAAVAEANPGDVITLAPGVYDLTGNIRCTRPGAPGAPIVVRSERLGEAAIRFDAVEGFHVLAPYWTFENLDIEGVCASHSDCEHAFHIVGEADHTVVRGSRLHEYNAMVKGNGTPGSAGGPWSFPDDVVIEYNELFNSTPRNTGNPVTPIDVVGGRRWVIRGNFIHDHAKGGGDGISYAAFLKGNSRQGLIERNLVICELLHRGQIRLGLSFGGGGSNPDSICEDGTCTPEHRGGIMRNNLIVNCPADVGIYLNEAADSQVDHNTLFNTAGIDVRFAASSVRLANNLLSGRIRNRDGGRSQLVGNIENVTDGDFHRWFEAPEAADFRLKMRGPFIDGPPSGVPDDYCGQSRDDGAPDVGAVEYTSAAPCDTTRPVRPAQPTPTTTTPTAATPTAATPTGTTPAAATPTGRTPTPPTVAPTDPRPTASPESSPEPTERTSKTPQPAPVVIWLPSTSSG